MMDRRRSKRLSVEVAGSYLSPSGRMRTVFVSQISAAGCRLEESENRLSPGEHIALNLGPVGPLPATVRWTSERHAGVQFDAPLETAIVAYFAAFCPRAA